MINQVCFHYKNYFTSRFLNLFLTFNFTTDADDSDGQDPQRGLGLDGQRCTFGLLVSDAAAGLRILQAGANCFPIQKDCVGFKRGTIQSNIVKRAQYFVSMNYFCGLFVKKNMICPALRSSDESTDRPLPWEDGDVSGLPGGTRGQPSGAQQRSVSPTLARKSDLVSQGSPDH